MRRVGPVVVRVELRHCLELIFEELRGVRPGLVGHVAEPAVPRRRHHRGVEVPGVLVLDPAVLAVLLVPVLPVRVPMMIFPYLNTSNLHSPHGEHLVPEAAPAEAFERELPAGEDGGHFSRAAFVTVFVAAAFAGLSGEARAARVAVLVLQWVAGLALSCGAAARRGPRLREGFDRCLREGLACSDGRRCAPATREEGGKGAS